ncbi:hypothetical protein QQ045_003927 [Rhodiola kirilowii]
MTGHGRLPPPDPLPALLQGVNASNSDNPPTQTFAAIARSRPRSLFPPLQLAPRHVSQKDGKPMISFTKAEVQAGRERLQILSRKATYRRAQDANTILAHHVRKIDQSLFRVFRWSPNYNTRKKPTSISTWVRLPALPPDLYDQGFIASIVSNLVDSSQSTHVRNHFPILALLGHALKLTLQGQFHLRLCFI